MVLFHPDAAFGWRLHKILTQFSSVILVDNTPKGAALTNLPSSVRVLQNGRNLGIATALNKGIDLAIEKGYEWVATFDQDSEILPGYLENMVSISARQTPTPVLVGCNYLHDGDTKVVHRAPHKATEAWARQTLITSGTFMPACFAREIGGFREDYFIDSVDHEFCLRATSPWRRNINDRAAIYASPYGERRRLPFRSDIVPATSSNSTLLPSTQYNSYHKTVRHRIPMLGNPPDIPVDRRRTCNSFYRI